MKKSFVFIFVILTLIACSRKSTGFVSKSYHNVTTWNNILFNGELDMEKTLSGKEESYQDDYFEILKVEPIDYFPKENMEISMPTMGTGTMFKNNSGGNDSENENSGPYSIPEQKALKAIEKHSMLIKGEEYNKMMTRAYIMLGKSKMYSGDYFEAIEAFNYINKNFDKANLKIDNNIYIAEAQEQLGNMYDAKSLYEELADQKLSKSQQKLFTKKYSQFLINTENDSLAFDVLNWSYKRDKNKKNRGRYRYIQGQLMQKMGDFEKAKEYYVKAYKKKPGFEMEVKSQLAIASMFDPKTDNLDQTEKNLNRILKKGTYKAQKNEIYFALGEISQRIDSTGRAEEYYQKALEYPQSDVHVRTLTYSNYGDILYKKKEYIKASQYYDSAFITVAKEEVKEALESKSKNLKKLVEFYTIVKDNDSILALTQMSKPQQEDYFNNYIQKLKDKESESEFLEDTEFELNRNDNFNFDYSPKGKFYFYNENLKANGQVEFQRKWGNRALKDNWRYSSGFQSQDDIDPTEATGIAENDPRRFDLEYYMDRIPNNPLSIDSLKVQRDSAELNLAILYLDKMNDNESSLSSLNHLIDSNIKQEPLKVLAYYYLYQASKDDNPQIAAKAKSYMLDNYPNSKYTQYILNPNTNYFTEESAESKKFYDQTYQAYEDGDYQKVIDNSNNAIQRFPKDEIIAKFALLRAYAVGKQGNVEEFEAALERISIMFEGTPEAYKAEEILNELKKENE